MYILETLKSILLFILTEIQMTLKGIIVNKIKNKITSHPAMRNDLIDKQGNRL